jgi:putative acetyltransferase
MRDQDVALTLRPETPSDVSAISAVLRASFPTPLEAELVERLRSDGDLAVSLVASVAGEIVGHVAFSKTEVVGGAGVRPVAWLAPLAVLEPNRRRGIAQGLVLAGIELSRTQGYDYAVVVGEPSYYARFGFTHAAARKLESRWFCAAMMAMPLDTEAPELAGLLKEPKAFSLLQS